MKINRYILFFCLSLFALTRVYIWVAKPVAFTEIIDVYMPYAHLWASGVKPYLEQWYEYPPATIPLFYLPHLVDMATLPYIWHINYGLAYRGLLLLTDIGIFSMIYYSLKKFKVKPVVFAGALIYYSLATAKAHDFMYDSMDLTFVGALAMGMMASVWLPTTKGKLWEWFGYFLAVALKLINGPLGLIYAVFERKQLKRLVVTIAVAGFLVWSLPLTLYRSSLSVMLVYHSMRGLQVESVPAQIVSLINRFTNTETYNNQYRSVNIAGPVSEVVMNIFNRLFVIALLAYIIWGTKVAWQTPLKNQPTTRIALTFGYLFCFILFAKVLSTPYHLWQIPLLSLYPFKSLKRQLAFTLPSLFMIVISMTKIPNIPFGVLNLHLLIGLTRSVIYAYLLWQSIRLVRAATQGRS